ncbi:hypothetical protein [Alkalibacterium sp. 20]|uniref:hypothetical protein n=1 Tax=Alkalibacterium sp. 20 TaxID=1798803 RepID=UPI0008FFF5EE|nr:hypothetical protein [Alkalibacterium sp. 20]OJF94629.1 hypothetical protein AX762_01825 [Alkalibacterium sp. 20]
MKKLVERLNAAFNLTEDLVNGLSVQELELTLGDLPSNTIGEQIWCIVGARESYLQAVIHNEWIGFSCSLKDLTSHSSVMDSLKSSSKACIDQIDSTDLNDTQIDYLFTLLEHEIQHHGQLIRYIYGNKLHFPKSWNERYTV